MTTVQIEVDDATARCFQAFSAEERNQIAEGLRFSIDSIAHPQEEETEIEILKERLTIAKDPNTKWLSFDEVQQDLAQRYGN